jgi:RHS repeat-associated protein
MRSRRLRQFALRVLPVTVVISVVGSGLPATVTAAHADTTALTLTGPTTLLIGQTGTYSGRLTVGATGTGVPLQSISVYVDGTATGTAQTGTDGTYTTPVSFSSYGTHTVQTAYSPGVNQVATTSPLLTVTVYPPANNTADGTDIAANSSWLYTGANAPQQGVAAGTILASRIDVVHGTVADRNGAPLAGVTVTIAGHPEYGSTVTRADGRYDLAVNGGQPLTVHLARTDLLPVERLVSPEWRDYSDVPAVTMLPPDPTVSVITASATTEQTVRGSQQTDSDGTRQATLLIPPSTAATMTLPDGSQQALGTLHVHATEVTVGPTGPSAMPATLPSTSAYTYAVGYTVDEAQAAGATGVAFSQPIQSYTDNFLNMPVGTPVPAGYYDEQKHSWIAEPDGDVIKILSVTNGEANLDLDGSGNPAIASALAVWGITDSERTRLAQLYAVGKTLWRVPITHFSFHDLNYGWGAPSDATASDQHINGQPSGGCDTSGSIIGCTRQTLGESLPIAGTPFTLNYDSGRVPGNAAPRTLDVGITGAHPPASLVGATIEVDVAGRIFTQDFSASPNQRFQYTWDGFDIYGRPVYGAAIATVKVGYIYRPVYYPPAPASSTSGGFASGPELRNFGVPGQSPAPVTTDSVRDTVTYWQITHDPIGALSTTALQALGGWSIDVHQAYDETSRTLYLGDGSTRPATRIFGGLTTAAGTGAAGPFGVGTDTGDGGLATAAGLSRVHGLAVGPDGSIYLTDTDNGVIRRIAPDGTISTVAGGGTPASGNGDGGPATSAALTTPTDVTVGPDGSLYIADSGTNSIRKVSSAGTITTYAGGGAPTDGPGDNGPATSAALSSPQGVAAAPDGRVYIADTSHNRIRVVTLDGRISTVAGGGSPADGLGDGLPGPQAALNHPLSVAVAADGAVYVADSDNNRVRKIGMDGLITTYAGTGVAGNTGDGNAATAAELVNPTSVSVDHNGTVTITESLSNLIRQVDSQGVIRSVAGNGTAGFSGDNGPALQAQLNRPSDTVVDQQGRLWIADTNNLRVRRLAIPAPGFSLTDFLLPSADGSEVYQFNANGVHLRTLDALTGITLYTFGYTANGQLATITDHFGNVTTIDRDANGVPTGIDSPYGQHTTLHVNADGYLDTITDPTNASTTLGYGSGGLLTSLIDPRRNQTTFGYDPVGRLTNDTAPDGKSTTLVRTQSDTLLTVEAITAEDRQTYYKEVTGSSTVEDSITGPSGLTSTNTTDIDGTQTMRHADGTVITSTFAPDPQWGIAVPYPATITLRRPSGVTATVTESRTVTLSDPSNPLSLIAASTSETQSGHTSSTTYNATTHTITTTTPAGRKTVTTLNADGQPATFQLGNFTPTTFTYADAHGRLTQVSQGRGASARVTTFDYGADGYVSAIHGPLHTSSFSNDADGRVQTLTLPDSNTVRFGFDANGNLTSLTPPGRTAHSYTFTTGNEISGYEPPALSTGATPSTYAYNHDRQATTDTLPDGRSITNGYDSAGRLTTITIGRGAVTLGYDSTTGLLATATDPSGVSQSNTFDGALITAVTTTGPVPGAVHYSYDADHLTTIQVGTQAAQSYGYDADSNITSANDLTIGYDPNSGAPTSTTDGSVATSTTYDAFGARATESATVNGSSVYAATYTRDTVGRTSELTETIAGVTTATDYTYDARDRLTDVIRGGVTVDHYDYDANGNRTTATGTSTATYDAQDRLMAIGSTTYAYNATGQLTSATTGSAVTTYNYDELGELQSVTKPDGTVISYLYDAAGRLVAKKINGSLVQGFLYGTGSQPLASTNAAGAVTATYTYTDTGTPDLITVGNTTYRVIADHLGSPRLIINAATGASVQHLEYDPYGSVTTDTNPGFQPFGFTGGLYDPDTGLVHLGARDYSPALGRFVTKDPTQFAGGDTNLYAYAGDDPINHIDPTGLDFWGDVSDWSAAFGDTVTFGGTEKIRRFVNYQFLGNGDTDSVDHCSIFYAWGGRGGQVASYGLAVVGIVGVASRLVAAKFAAEGGDLTGAERERIQSVVDKAGRPLHVVGSAARGARTAVSDIDYTSGWADYFDEYVDELPGMNEHGILRGGPDPGLGPWITFEPMGPVWP